MCNFPTNNTEALSPFDIAFPYRYTREEFNKNGGMKGLPKNPTEEQKLVAVEDSGSNIQYFENPSENLQLAAIGVKHGWVDHITSYWSNIRFIKNPTDKVRQKAIELSNGYILKENNIKLTQEEIKKCVETNAWVIRYVDNPSLELQIIAAKQLSIDDVGLTHDGDMICWDREKWYTVRNIRKIFCDEAKKYITNDRDRNREKMSLVCDRLRAIKLPYEERSEYDKWFLTK